MLSHSSLVAPVVALGAPSCTNLHMQTLPAAGARLLQVACTTCSPLLHINCDCADAHETEAMQSGQNGLKSGKSCFLTSTCRCLTRCLFACDVGRGHK